MKQRVITGLVFALIFIPSILIGGIYFYIVGLFVTYMATFELMNMFYKKNDGIKVMRYVVPVFSSILFSLLAFSINKNSYEFILKDGEFSYFTEITSPDKWGNKWLALPTVFMIFGVLVLGFISILLKNPGRSAIDLIFSFVYGGMIMSMALSVVYLPSIKTHYDGFFANIVGRTLLYVYIVVCLTDVFAYFVGMKFGKHRLCPTISPKKSVEGAIGGTVFGAVCGTVVAYLLRVMPVDNTMDSGMISFIVIVTFVISILISIGSQFGDLFASTLKREYEIKDYGKLLPGHGGILDRFDSLALSGAFFFVIYMIFALIFL